VRAGTLASGESLMEVVTRDNQRELCVVVVIAAATAVVLEWA
jgi:hypothetical protein